MNKKEKKSKPKEKGPDQPKGKTVSENPGLPDMDFKKFLGCGG